jgi:HTH-type transcriptional regulator / antitoxin HigA
MNSSFLTQEWLDKVTHANSPDIDVAGYANIPAPDAQQKQQFTQKLLSSATVMEIFKRGWLKMPTNAQASDQTARLRSLNEFLQTPNNCIPTVAQNRHAKSPTNSTILSDIASKIWIERLVAQASATAQSVTYAPDALNDSFLHALVRLSILEDGPVRAVQALRNIGISVIIQPGLPLLSIDATAMHLASLGPVIGLTLRQDRLDNFWFTLLHELGHINRHLTGPSSNYFCDEMEDERVELSELEHEADRYALTALIPKDAWEHSEVRREPTKTNVLKLALRLGINPAIVAGRYRFDNKNYAIFSDLIGTGQVRALFNHA